MPSHKENNLDGKDVGDHERLLVSYPCKISNPRSAFVKFLAFGTLCWYF